MPVSRRVEILLQEGQFKYELKLHEKKLEMQAEMDKKSNSETEAQVRKLFGAKNANTGDLEF